MKPILLDRVTCHWMIRTFVIRKNKSMKVNELLEKTGHSELFKDRIPYVLDLYSKEGIHDLIPAFECDEFKNWKLIDREYENCLKADIKHMNEGGNHPIFNDPEMAEKGDLPFMIEYEKKHQNLIEDIENGK